MCLRVDVKAPAKPRPGPDWACLLRLTGRACFIAVVMWTQTERRPGVTLDNEQEDSPSPRQGGGLGAHPGGLQQLPPHWRSHRVRHHISEASSPLSVCACGRAQLWAVSNLYDGAQPASFTLMCLQRSEEIQTSTWESRQFTAESHRPLLVCSDHYNLTAWECFLGESSCNNSFLERKWWVEII